jgi:hypothetical protein
MLIEISCPIGFECRYPTESAEQCQNVPSIHLVIVHVFLERQII